eukprot:GHVQ01032752.1.p1 GENE.GHVQ01032752.1~~GHVQ01032752.1.p1  ORF type:complete len:425 (-),score=33.70 GHVQ01032752.1:1344-2618(-)
MSSDAARKIREDKSITIIEGADRCPNPVFSFELASLPQKLEEKLLDCYEHPSPVQVQGWPIALSGHDLIAIAETGSGKTLGFLVPAFVHILNQSRLEPGDGPICLVMSPTRELAMQIDEQAKEFGECVDIRSVCCYGGVRGSKVGQMSQLRSGREICVAAPGRLIDILQSSVGRDGCNLRRVTYFVLDEADRLLDQGFGPNIKTISSQIRRERQTLMWSATWARDVQDMANFIFKNPKEKPFHMEIGTAMGYKILPGIEQKFEALHTRDNNERLKIVLNLLSDHAGKKFLVFCNTKVDAEAFTLEMRRGGINAMSLHGDKEQTERSIAFSSFRSGACDTLVATDVAARGLDINDIDFVVNAWFPKDLDTYVHRIGRTARAGKRGTAVTLLTIEELRHRYCDLATMFVTSKLSIPESLRMLAGGR